MIDTEKLIIHNSVEFHTINPNKILYISSDGNYSNIYLTDGGLMQTIPFSIGQIADKIHLQLSARSDSKFVRLGRQFIVNVSHILSIYPTKKQLIFDVIHPCEKTHVRIYPSSSALSSLIANLATEIDSALLREASLPQDEAEVDDDTCVFLNEN